MEDILKRLNAREISLEHAISEMRDRMLGSLESNIDPGREARTGYPEIVLSEGKTLDQLITISTDLLRRSGRVIISRLDQDRSEDILAALGESATDYDPVSRILVAQDPGS